MSINTNKSEEIVDIVNSNDEVIGQATRREANSTPTLVHREIGILVYDDDGRIYTQQRSRNKKVMPLVWTLSTCGHVPAGMTPLDAAHIELQEELGFDTDLEFTHKEVQEFATEKIFGYHYIAKIPKGVEIKLDLEEAEQGRFVSETELDEMIAQGEKIEEYSLIDFRKFWTLAKSENGRATA